MLQVNQQRAINHINYTRGAYRTLNVVFQDFPRPFMPIFHDFPEWLWWWWVNRLCSPALTAKNSHERVVGRLLNKSFSYTIY